MKILKKLKEIKNNNEPGLISIYYAFTLPIIGLISLILLFVGLLSDLFSHFLIGFFVGFSIVCALVSLIVSIVILTKQKEEKLLSIVSISISIIYIAIFSIVFIYLI